MSFLFKTKEKQAEVIEIVDSWFDCMNSRRIWDTKKASCAFGLNLDEQMTALNKMEMIIKTMKINGRSSQLPFQKGFLMSIQSMRGLFAWAKLQGLSFILTSHLNQDVLENLFSRLRAIGGNNNHPSGIEVLRRLKILLIGKDNHHIVLNSPAVQVQSDNFPDGFDNDDFVSKDLTKDVVSSQCDNSPAEEETTEIIIEISN